MFGRKGGEGSTQLSKGTSWQWSSCSAEPRMPVRSPSFLLGLGLLSIFKTVQRKSPQLHKGLVSTETQEVLEVFVTFGDMAPPYQEVSGP